MYVEKTSNITIADGQAIAEEFDNNIYTQITTNFGTESDVDSNGKIILLFLDIKDGYSGSGGYVAGYFYSYHEFDSTTYPYSNEADMIFLDTYPAVAGSSSSFETVAHEFQHLINFSTTYFDNGTYQETWINEGLSSGAEYVYSGEVSQSRVDYYNADPQLSTNPDDSIAYGNNFFIWGNDLEDYATVSLFFQWLRIHASNGTGIYKEILASSYRDYRAVTSAAVSQIDAQFSDWGDLLSTWMIANILDDEVELPSDYSGYLWYKDEINPVTRRFNSANNATCYLYPGERIFSTMPSENTPPGSGTNIEYAGITTDGTIDRTSPYSGDYALVFNSYSSLVNPVQETGYVANVEIPEPTLSRAASAEYTLLESYKVDVMFNPDGTIGGVGE